jgi:hypothetical protein
MRKGEYDRVPRPEPLPEYPTLLACGHTHVASPTLPKRFETLWCPRCRVYRERHAPAPRTTPDP